VKILSRFRHEIVRGLIVVVVAMFGTYMLNQSRAFHAFEHLILSLEENIRENVRTKPPPPIVVVKISDLEYDDYFDGVNPLNPEKLDELIYTILWSGASLIAVDIDTSHGEFRNFKIDPKLPVFWERDASIPESGKEQEIVPLDVLGGSDPNTFVARSGVPALLDDPMDGVTRLYKRCIETRAGPVPSFVNVIATAWNSPNKQIPDIGNICGDGDTTQLYVIGYSFDETDIVPAQVLISSGEKSDHQGELIVPALKDKLVLLGGSYRDFDRHFTPIGTRPGVVVLANALQTVLVEKHPTSYPPVWVLFVLELVAATGIVVLFAVADFSATKALLVGVLGLGLAAGLGRFVSWSWSATIASTLLAVLAFEIYEHVRHKSVLHVAHSKGRKA